jgi:hypothetical protein
MVREGVAVAWASSAICSGLMGWLLVTSRLKQVRLRQSVRKTSLGETFTLSQKLCFVVRADYAPRF